MKISTLKSKCKLLNINSNAKTSKGDDENQMTAIMYLASSDMSGYDTCEHASPQCKKMCLISAGRGAFSNVQRARINRTKLYFEDQPAFLKQLYEEITYFTDYCDENGMKSYVRLNGTSDLNFVDLEIKDEKDIFQLFPDVQFYDYTKDFERVAKHSNYYLLYSRSETTTTDVVKGLVEEGKNVAVVFDEVPELWQGMEVVSGDETDLRPIDKQGVIVGLKAKGMAKKNKRTEESDKGFVIETLSI